MSVYTLAYMTVAADLVLSIAWSLWLDFKLMMHPPRPEDYASHREYVQALMDWEAVLTRRVQPKNKEDGW